MNTLNLKGTFQFLKRHSKTLIITFVVSGISAGLLSLLLPNYYKSEVLLLPSEVSSISKSILSEGDRLDPYMLGTEKESEYILEMLSSWQIIEKTAAKFNLKEHYGLTKISPLVDERMYLKLRKNIKIKRSDYMGAKLQVWDKDPKYACDMANYMVEQLQALRQRMKQAKADSIKVELQKSRYRVQQDILRLNDSVSKLQQQTGIVYPNTYCDRISQELAKQIAAGNTGAVARLEEKLANASKYASHIQQLLNDMENKSKTIKAWDEHYEQAILDLESNIPVDFIAQYATISYKKDKPQRSLIAILGAIACTLIALEYFVIKERYLNNDPKDKTLS